MMTTSEIRKGLRLNWMMICTIPGVLMMRKAEESLMKTTKTNKEETQVPLGSFLIPSDCNRQNDETRGKTWRLML